MYLNNLPFLTLIVEYIKISQYALYLKAVDYRIFFSTCSEYDMMIIFVIIILVDSSSVVWFRAVILSKTVGV